MGHHTPRPMGTGFICFTASDRIEISGLAVLGRSGKIRKRNDSDWMVRSQQPWRRQGFHPLSLSLSFSLHRLTVRHRCKQVPLPKVCTKACRVEEARDHDALIIVQSPVIGYGGEIYSDWSSCCTFIIRYYLFFFTDSSPYSVVASSGLAYSTPHRTDRLPLQQTPHRPSELTRRTSYLGLADAGKTEYHPCSKLVGPEIQLLWVRAEVKGHQFAGPGSSVAPEPKTRRYLSPLKVGPGRSSKAVLACCCYTSLSPHYS